LPSQLARFPKMQAFLLLQYRFGWLILFTTFKHRFANNQSFIFGAVNFQFGKGVLPQLVFYSLMC
jgi:hypothetical protein